VYSIRKGLHHVTFEAIVESRDDAAHGFVDVFEDGSISIEGLSAVSSRELRLEEATGVPAVPGEWPDRQFYAGYGPVVDVLLRLCPVEKCTSHYRAAGKARKMEHDLEPSTVYRLTLVFSVL